MGHELFLSCIFVLRSSATAFLTVPLFMSLLSFLVIVGVRYFSLCTVGVLVSSGFLHFCAVSEQSYNAHTIRPSIMATIMLGS